jgi:uncharacterized protein YabE (DUF348 family)/3D (Asp-Asp-Asp) domain-containing protein
MLEAKNKARKKLLALSRIAALALPIMIMVLLMTQTAFAKTTYVINDGGNIVLHATFETDPVEILDEVGLELGENDTYTSTESLGVSSIHIQRIQNITVVCGQQTYTLTTYGETVEQLLKRDRIQWDENDILSVDLNEETYDGMKIVIQRVDLVEETFTESIPYETWHQFDESLRTGKTEVITEGVPGVLTNTATITYIDGVEVGREITNRVVTTAPVMEVIAVGTASGEIVRPIPGQLVIGEDVIYTPDGKTLYYDSTLQVVATAYHNTDPGCTIYTAIGTLCRVGAIAVDPKVIPYGTKMYIITNDGKYIYGEAVAEDCGSAIKGNRVDLYFDTTDECWTFGIREATVFFITEE